MSIITSKSSIDWNYDIIGEGGSLVFFHGWGVDLRIWRQQYKYFSTKYKVVRFDLPGHGKSGWKSMSFQDIAGDLDMVMDELGLNNIVSVGSSLGGLLSLRLYEISPERFKKMVFVGAVPKFSRSKDFPYGLDVEKIRKLGGQLDTSYPSIVNVFFRSLFTKEERSSRRYKWLQKFRQFNEAPMKPALVEYLSILEKEDLTEILRKIDIPAQFINGAGDTICNMDAIDHLKELVPKGRFDIFDKCGHFPFLSKPHEFNEVLEEFLLQ